MCRAFECCARKHVGLQVVVIILDSLRFCTTIHATGAAIDNGTRLVQTDALGSFPRAMDGGVAPISAAIHGSKTLLEAPGRPVGVRLAGRRLLADFARGLGAAPQRT